MSPFTLIMIRGFLRVQPRNPRNNSLKKNQRSSLANRISSEMSNPQKSASTSRNSSPYPSTSGSTEDLSNLVLPVRTSRSFERQSFHFSKLCLFFSGEASDEIINNESIIELQLESLQLGSKIQKVLQLLCQT